MKISIPVMITITTLFCVLPYLWFILIGKNNNKKKEKLFKDVIKNENLTFNKSEQWNNNFIGIDESQNILIFIKLTNQGVTISKVDLKLIKSCEINRKTTEIKKDNKIEINLQSLDLDLVFLLKSEIIKLHFYNSTDEFSEDFELKRAQKWQSLIQQSIPKTSLNKDAA